MITFEERKHNIMTWIGDVMEEKLDDFEKTWKHISEKHVNKSNLYLRRRILTEKIRIASTFLGEEYDIYRCIRESLLEEESLDAVAEYLADQEFLDDYMVFCPMPENDKVTGICYLSDINIHKWDKPISCHEFVAVFGKSKRKCDNDFYMKSIYLVPPGY